MITPPPRLDDDAGRAGAGRARLVTAVAIAAFLLAPAAIVYATAGRPVAGRPTSRAKGAKLLRVDSGLPAWVAPGGTLTVSGWAAAGARVALLAGRHRLVQGRSGPLGRFRLEAFAPAPGLHRIAVESRGLRRQAGRIEVRPLVLAAVGDVSFGGGADSAVAKGARYPWLSVASLLRKADLATANLEGAVSARGVPISGKQYHFRGPPSALRGAAGFAGIDVFSLANNHTLDFGREAFLDTIHYARAQGVATVGGGASLIRARRPAILQAGGLRVAFLGYSDVRPLGFDAAPATPGTAPAFPELIAADVRAARRRADLVVVWFHWGIERDVRPSSRQSGLAQVALASGASVVLGAHPHVLQPIDRYGRKLVAWSLGNFVFAASSPDTASTGVLLVRLDARGVRGYTFRPARIARGQPRLSERAGRRA